MGINERKAKEKEIRRNDILEAAERVFFRDGYAVSTMDNVAKEAEFSKRTVYVYFNSKEQIYFEIMVRGYKLLIGMLEAELKNENQQHALDKIKQIGTIIYRFSKDYPEYFTAIVEYENGEMDFKNGIPDKAREECYALGEELSLFLSSALNEGIEEGVIRRELDVVNTTLILWACIIGVFTTTKKKAEYIKNYHDRNPDQLVFEAFELLIKSIKREKEGI
ncbi:TetR/AcrR family transcriptional regulator [Paenibacillus sp. BR2-3]|uniref:TetR/AcrR family transcriptional regulator n=1 Tax=Paenibacillus sp. BR2-3 TaxID=3048494 RepID=UPI0039779ABA